MARKKKVEDQVENHNATVKRFLKKCVKDDGTVRCITPRIDEIYLIDGKSYMFTKEVADSMMQTGKVRISYESDKEIHLAGIKNNSLKSAK